jgi:hypothetical protein
VQRLAAQLIHDRFDDLGMPVSNVEDAEPAQAIDVLAPAYVAVGVRSGIGPLDYRFGAFRVGRFPVFQEAWVDVIAKRFDRFARDPRRVGRCDLPRVDEI